MSHVPLTIIGYTIERQGGSVARIDRSSRWSTKTMPQTTPSYLSDVDTFLQIIRFWLTDPAGQTERRLLICAVQRHDVVQLIDGTPLDLAMRRITGESGQHGAASRPGQTMTLRSSCRDPGHHVLNEVVQRGRTANAPPVKAGAVDDDAMMLPANAP